MDNRVYYGQYSLKHWLDLILKQNITLPNYQRYFVWDEVKVKNLIETFKNKQFVPPITIGAFKIDNSTQNLILDGQQRLTTILLAYLGLYPDETTFKGTVERLANENDDDVDGDEQLDNILKWDFNRLTEKGKSKIEILDKITPGNYKNINFDISDDFLKKTFLGFSYLVPQTDDQQIQQKYYSSVFRNINVQGQRLLPQESRASLYFLKKDLEHYFDPEFAKQITIKNFSSETTVDFLRFLALLSQYAKDGTATNIAKGFKSKIEDYYEDYIYSVAGEVDSTKFQAFTAIFPDGNYAVRFERLHETLDALQVPKQFTSIIEMDVYLFGLIYTIVFQNRVIDLTKREEIVNELEQKITQFKSDAAHRKAPSALKYLKGRIESSIEIYNKYVNGETH
jgi:uncharacterized protein with ParB-like and HNH nuclease domain